MAVRGSEFPFVILGVGADAVHDEGFTGVVGDDDETEIVPADIEDDAVAGRKLAVG